MNTTRKRIRKRVGLGTKPSQKKINVLTQDTSGNLRGPKTGPSFAGMLKEILIKPRKYRNNKTGELFESTEMYLIIRRAVKELRTSTQFDVRLFEVLMNRVDGRPKENLDVDGIKEIASGVNAQDVILSRLAGLARARGTRGNSPKDVSRRAIEDTVPMEPVAQN